MPQAKVRFGSNPYEIDHTYNILKAIVIYPKTEITTNDVPSRLSFFVDLIFIAFGSHHRVNIVPETVDISTGQNLRKLFSWKKNQGAREGKQGQVRRQ